MKKEGHNHRDGKGQEMPHERGHVEHVEIKKHITENGHPVETDGSKIEKCDE